MTFVSKTPGVLPILNTSAALIAQNPVLLYGQVAQETDTNRSKSGDGVSTYTQLTYTEWAYEIVEAAGTDTYTGTFSSPFFLAYFPLMRIRVRFSNANTGASTINLNGLGAKAIKKNVSTALVSGDILAGAIHDLYYDGTNFQISNGVGTAGIVPTFSQVLTAGNDGGGLGAVNFKQIVNTVAAKQTIFFADAALALQMYMAGSNGNNNWQVIGQTNAGTGLPSVSLSVYDILGGSPFVTGIAIARNAVTISGTLTGTFPGAVYAADYSANYTTRSLIDKGYAAATYLAIGATAGGDLSGTYPNPAVFQAHLTDQAAPAAPAVGTLILASFNQQGFSVPHVYDTQGNAIEIIRDNIFVARNNTGSSIAKGKAVYCSGSTGAVPNVALAKADSNITLGLVGVMYETTANNSFGRVMMLGNLENYDLSAFANGDVLYVDATTAGNLTATKPSYPNYPQVVGIVLNNGVGNGVLQVYTRGISGTAIITDGQALTKVDDTNVTLTLGGTPATSLLRAASLTLGWNGQLGLTRGGTNASLVASNGGIFYSTATAGAILAGTATAGQMLRSGASAAPTWSTATFPATATGTGTILRADGTNWVASTPTYPNAATTTGAYMRADGTNFIQSTLILPNAITANYVVYGSATNTYGSSSNLQFDGTNLGIGMVPSNALDVTKNQNSASSVAILNNSGGTGGYAAFLANNGTYLTNYGQLGTGYTTNGILLANAAFTYTTSTVGYSIIAGGAGSNIKFASGGTTEMMRLNSTGNLKLAGTATRATTEGTNHLDIFDGTAPVGTLTNGISLYSTSGELRVMDAAGNATLLSPHEKNTNYWIYDSIDTTTGKRLKIDMEQFMKWLNKKHGLDFVHEYLNNN